ncbi:MAG: YggS family pyridoxal phosphate-dependent enzyme [Gammaproteobacteria bacterium]|nr:YggS family pyridoxal phosphate-dependent enzyme [Gammaproteobacteria bacterium]
MTVITEHKARIDARIAAAARAAGRDPAAVRILGVSKRQPRDRVLAALAAGITDLGENYVQDAIGKVTEFGPGPVWHFIGHVQSNKTRPIAEHFHWVQTITNSRIARRLSAQRPFHAEDLQVCIQVAPRGEPGRGGALPDDIPALAAEIEELPRLQLRGLMVMPLGGLSTKELADEFRAGRELFDALRESGHAVDTLSMGMSADLETAVAEGSTMVRIGTDLFGPREDS